MIGVTAVAAVVVLDRRDNRIAPGLGLRPPHGIRKLVFRAASPPSDLPRKLRLPKQCVYIIDVSRVQ